MFLLSHTSQDDLVEVTLYAHKVPFWWQEHTKGSEDWFSLKTHFSYAPPPSSSSSSITARNVTDVFARAPTCKESQWLEKMRVYKPVRTGHHVWTTERRFITWPFGDLKRDQFVIIECSIGRRSVASSESHWIGWLHSSHNSMSDFPYVIMMVRIFFYTLLQNEGTGKTLGMEGSGDDYGFCLRITLARFQKICLRMGTLQEGFRRRGTNDNGMAERTASVPLGTHWNIFSFSYTRRIHF